MSVNKIINKILSDVCLREEIQDGIFSLENNDHISVLRNYLIENEFLNEENARIFCNNVVEGKYPERQAYNKNGILVTFPTPEYKKRAIDRGTHFEKDPTKKEPNVFGPEQKPETQTSDASSTTTDSTQNKDSDVSNLPVSDTQKSDQQQTTTSPNEPVSAEKGDVEQTPKIQIPQDTIQQAPTQPVNLESPPIPEPKTPEEKLQDKKAIINILKESDSMLESIVDWVVNNGPEYLLKQIKK